MRIGHAAWTIVAAMFSCVVTIAATDPEAKSEKESAPKPGVGDLGMTQGDFALLMIKESAAERLFTGPITAMSAAEKLASVGLAPEKGWDVKKPLTRDDLVFAHKRLTDKATPATADAGDGAGKGDKPVAVDVGRLSIPKLIDAIVEALKKVFADIKADRQPVSPTGADWNY